MAQEGRGASLSLPALGSRAAASVRHGPLFLATPLGGELLLKAERTRGRRENAQSPWTWVVFAHPPPPTQLNVSVVLLSLRSTPTYLCAHSAAASDQKSGINHEGRVSGWGGWTALQGSWLCEGRGPISSALSPHGHPVPLRPRDFWAQTQAGSSAFFEIKH